MTWPIAWFLRKLHCRNRYTSTFLAPSWSVEERPQLTWPWLAQVSYVGIYLYLYNLIMIAHALGVEHSCMSLYSPIQERYSSMSHYIINIFLDFF
jgi:hypothetical protein